MGIERVDYYSEEDFLQAQIEEEYRDCEEGWNKEAEEERRQDEEMARWGDDYLPEEVESEPDEYDDLPF